jgi:L-ascorbate metabolism protein UlaG (beta-lactamase superfamily)
MPRTASRSRRAAGTLLAAIWLVPAAPAAGHVPAGTRGGEKLALASASRAETIALRRRYLGRDNVDARTGAVRRDRVILSWVGVSNFVMAIRGHVVLLDAWVPRGAHSGYVPSSPAELAKLRPAAILIGHAHFDHAADAVPIAEASGATLVGSAEQCAELRSRAAATPPRCVEALPAGTAPGGTAPVDALRGVGVRIVKHVHSGAKAPGADPTGYHVPVLPPPSTTVLEHPPTPADMAQLVERAPDAEAGSVLYRFEVGDFTLVWHDSSGPLADEAPEAFAALRALRPVDVQVGAIQGFNQVTNGMRDPRMYVEALQPRVFVPAHHDDWAAGITTKGEHYRAPLDAELGRIPPDRRPSVRFLSDPADYVRPEILTFPVQLPGPALTRRCIGAGRLRVGLRGDTTDVDRAELVLGRERRALSGQVVLPRRAVARAVRRRARLSARVTSLDGRVATLRRSLPSCGLRRSSMPR